MAVKHRHSRTRGRKRRTHQKLDKPNPSYNSRDDEFHLPHRISPKGTYKGIKYVETEE